mgnify:CR=1 FL=1
MSFKENLSDAAQKYGIKLSEYQLLQFDKYFKLLLEWNEKINLTAITDPKEVAIKHMIDSISCWDDKLFDENITVIDVGTGAGFPGLPLKIYKPDIKLTLLDSLNKRVNFLNVVSNELGLTNVKCIHGRAEEAGRNKELREKFDFVVSRAVARFPVLAEYCLPFVKKGGVFAALKGMKYAQEAEAGKRAIEILGGGIPRCVEVKLPDIDDRRAVIYITKKKTTPNTYPRKAGTPDKNPLL